MKPPCSRRRLLALVIGGFVPLLVVLVALRGLGPWLVVNEPLVRGDVIFVVEGQTPQRELEGAALFLEGWAPRVALTRPRDGLSEEVRRLAGYTTPQERSSRVLLRRDVPETAIVRLDRIVDNTLQELEVDFDYARAQGFRRVILVTSPYHTRRIRVIWNSRFERELPAVVRTTRYERVDLSRWWRSLRSLEYCVHEAVGITHFLLGSPIPTYEGKR